MLSYVHHRLRRWSALFIHLTRYLLVFVEYKQESFISSQLYAVTVDLTASALSLTSPFAPPTLPPVQTFGHCRTALSLATNKQLLESTVTRTLTYKQPRAASTFGYGNDYTEQNTSKVPSSQACLPRPLHCGCFSWQRPQPPYQPRQSSLDRTHLAMPGVTSVAEAISLTTSAVPRGRDACRWPAIPPSCAAPTTSNVRV